MYRAWPLFHLICPPVILSDGSDFFFFFFFFKQRPSFFISEQDVLGDERKYRCVFKKKRIFCGLHPRHAVPRRPSVFCKRHLPSAQKFHIVAIVREGGMRHQCRLRADIPRAMCVERRTAAVSAYGRIPLLHCGYLPAVCNGNGLPAVVLRGAVERVVVGHVRSRHAVP